MTPEPHAVNAWYDRRRVAEAVAEGRHRHSVGGLWDEIGRLQLDFLVERGLAPDMRLLDIGCGCLRGGVHLVRHLDPGRYFGIDISPELLDAGYDVELAAAGLQDRLPRSNLVADGEFRFDRVGERFDMALAQSLFTHLPMNHIRLCLTRLAPVMRPGATLYATILHCPDDADWTEPIVHAGGQVTSHPTRDPFHLRYGDVERCAAELPWRVEPIGAWGHPRGQVMVALTRTP